MLHTDGQRLSQILINLLTNAAKFTTEGSITPHFSEVQEDQRGRSSFSVTDTGQHFLPTNRTIFNRFENSAAEKKAPDSRTGNLSQIAIVIGSFDFRRSATIEPGARFIFIHHQKKFKR